jgi:hypothetical protein
VHDALVFVLGMLAGALLARLVLELALSSRLRRFRYLRRKYPTANLGDLWRMARRP